MPLEIPPEAREDILKLQQLQQQLQVLMVQKQDIQVQLIEIESAAKELEKEGGGEAYEIVGSVMIKKSKPELLASLKEKKELLELRLSKLDKQIELLSKKSKEIQNKLIELTKKEK